jgi:hypothetical protein
MHFDRTGRRGMNFHGARSGTDFARRFRARSLKIAIHKTAVAAANHHRTPTDSLGSTPGRGAAD